MTISRPHVCEIDLARAEPDDEGNVTVTLWGPPFLAGTARNLTPSEAREFAAELAAAATEAETYLNDQEARA